MPKMTKSLVYLAFHLFLVTATYGQNVDYYRTVIGGPFINPVLWSPYDPLPPPPYYLGPGGATDDVHFDLGQSFLNMYSISGVSGINDQLFVENDSVALEIDGTYELATSIRIGETSGDVGIVLFSGNSGSELRSENTYLGSDSGAFGTVIINDPDLTWNNSDAILIGNGGSGFFSLLKGNVTSDEGWIGYFGERGEATVSGENSQWHNHQHLYVGIYVDAILDIEDGGLVTSDEVSIADIDGPTATVTIRDPGSCLMVQDILVGRRGNGSLDILDGGSLVSTFSSDIGIHDESQGYVNVIGTDSIWMANSIQLGNINFDPGEGWLFIDDGGQVLANQLRMDGNQLLAARTIVGENSILNLTYNAYVGCYRKGIMNIDDGGVVACDSIGIACFNNDAEGQVQIQATPSSGPPSRLEIANNLEISGWNGVPSLGEGEIQISLGSVVSAINVCLYTFGKVSMYGGDLFAEQIKFVNSGGTFCWYGGALHIGTFHDDLLSEGGTLAPGTEDNVIGSTTIWGSYTQDAESCMEIDIGGTVVDTEYDFINVADDAVLDGELKINLVNGFVPTPGDTFTILNAASIFGFFENVSDNERLETLDGSGSFLVRYGPTSPFSNQIVLSDFEPDEVLGDVNGDGEVNLLDVGPFIDLVSSGDYLAEADINQDGEVNLLDVGPFIELLAG